MGEALKTVDGENKYEGIPDGGRAGFFSAEFIEARRAATGGYNVVDLFERLKNNELNRLKEFFEKAKQNNDGKPGGGRAG